VLDWCVELGIPTVTLWVFSTDNFRRPPEEVSGILASIEAKLRALASDPAIHRRRVRVRAIGCRAMLPEPVLTAIAAAECATAEYDGLELNIAVAYGGRQEIADAVRALLNGMADDDATLAEAVEGVTPEAIAKHLYTAGLPDPDLIIRTSGEVRLSGFLLWQSAHSEFYFTDVLWPAFRKIDFLRAIRSFQQRRRRFGC
jgi:short-chain Z-isoprenyl diphosphate synthase